MKHLPRIDVNAANTDDKIANTNHINIPPFHNSNYTTYSILVHYLT